MSLSEHMQKYADRVQARYASEAVIERLADDLVGRHGLSIRRWECEDERAETLAEIVSEAVNRHGFDDAQEEYLRDLLREMSG